MKHCKDCGLSKPAADFYSDKRTVGGLYTYCKPCSKARAVARYRSDPAKHAAAHRAYVLKNPERIRAHKVKSAYGLTAAEFNAIAKVCVICGAIDRLCVDHSHQSGRVRGLLCQPCNKGLGLFRDNPALLARASEYVLGLAKPDIFEATYEPADEQLELAEGGTD